MISTLAARRMSRRRVLESGTAVGAALTLAACGAPIVVERVVVIPKIVEREVVVERPVITERTVIVEQEVAVEKEVVVTRLVTPPPTPAPTPRPTVATPAPALVRATLHAAISPALAREGRPDLSAVDSMVDLRLETLDAGHASEQRLLARAAAGDLPDLLLGVAGGLVTALDRLEALAPLDTALDEAHGFLPEMLALGRHERGLVGMPLGGYPTYLLASQRRLDEGGVADVGATYAALAETAQRLTDPETYTYGLGVVAGLPELETVTRSAGLFPSSEAAVQAWQWYADQWLHERVSPPPSAWDGEGAAGEAILSGRVALSIAHGRALNRLAARSGDTAGGWDAWPLPAWPDAERQTPMAGAFIAVRQGSDEAAADTAVALPGPARAFDRGPGTPAWPPALRAAAARLGLDPEHLLEARDAWTRPLAESADWRRRTMDLDAAVHDSLTLGQPAAEAAAALQTNAAASAARG